MPSRAPCERLRPFVRLLWATTDSACPQSAETLREHVLPTGLMHIAFRIDGDPVRLYRDASDLVGEEYGWSVLAGPRSGYYAKAVSVGSASVGAQLNPGTAALLFNGSAQEIAERHWRADEVLGKEARSIRERLCAAHSPEERIRLLESFLVSRLPRVRGIHPAVAMALERFQCSEGVRTVVEETGYSHRHFIGLFRDAVGLSPKTYCRLQRFQRALELNSRGSTSLAELAAAAGYSDQSHLSREFLEFTGATPGEYRRIAPPQRNHLAR